MMGWDGFGYSPWWGLLMMLFWVAVIVGVVVLIAWLIRQGQGQGGQPPSSSGGDRALQILRERYARGEISEDEFERMRRTLE